MGYPVLSKLLDKSQYEKYMGKKVLFDGKVVKVGEYESENRQGSYERGIKWSHRRYGLLIRNETNSGRTVSADHGKTWYRIDGSWLYRSVIRRTKKDKVVLGDSTTKEFAFDSIQEINRKWDGPNYRWRK